MKTEDEGTVDLGASQNVELLDLGDAMEETKQAHPLWLIPDSCCTMGNWF